MHYNYETIITASPGTTLQELYDRLAKVIDMEQALNLQLGTLNGVYEELSTYHNQIQGQTEADIHTFDYVGEGFQSVDRLLKEVTGTIDFQQIVAVRSSILLQIKELKEKVPKGNTQVNQHQGNSEFQDKATSNQETSINPNNNEQVTEYAEETIEHSK